MQEHVQTPLQKNDMMKSWKKDMKSTKLCQTNCLYISKQDYEGP